MPIPLLDAMPLVWLILLLLLAAAGIMDSTNGIRWFELVAAAAALASSISGLPPWTQTVVFCAADLLGGLGLRLWRQYRKRCSTITASYALLVRSAAAGETELIMYHGMLFPAQWICTAQSPCAVQQAVHRGDIVRISGRVGDTWLICPVSELEKKSV